MASNIIGTGGGWRLIDLTVEPKEEEWNYKGAIVAIDHKCLTPEQKYWGFYPYFRMWFLSVADADREDFDKTDLTYGGSAGIVLDDKCQHCRADIPSKLLDPFKVMNTLGGRNVARED